MITNKIANAKKAVRAIVLIVGGSIVGGLIAILGCCYVVDPLLYQAEFWLEPFNSSAWKAEKPAADGIQHTMRRCMIRDLSQHYLKKGMKRTEVVAILGEPIGFYGPKTMDYWLGYPRWWPTLDHEILEITLDDAGKVIGWTVRNT